MRVLMINSNRYKLPVPAMPFGLCYVSASLEEAGYQVRVLDLCFSERPERDIAEAVNDFWPTVVGVSIRNIDTVAHYKTLFYPPLIKKEVIEPLKRVFRGPVVIGGTAVGINGAELLDYLDLEYAIRGDGETAMTGFVDRFHRGLPLENLEGLIIRRNRKIVRDNPPHRVKNLDALPQPRQYKYLDLDSYRRFKAPIQVQSKRGCALECSYCTYNIIEGKHYRFRDPGKIADEIETIVKETGIDHFEFSDSTFNIPTGHAKAVLRAINAKNLDLNLQIMGLNPGGVDEELVQLMKEANFKEVQVGAESGSDAMLESLGKNFRKKDIIRTGELLHKAGIPVMWYLMTGAPGESRDTLAETFDTMEQAARKWDLVVIVNAIRVFKNSPLARRMLKEHPRCTSDNFFSPVFYPPEDIGLKEMRAFNKRIAFHYPNYLFPDEVQRVPVAALKFQTFMMKHFAPEKPWWKFNILVNRFMKAVGITAFRRMMFRFTQ
jgi:radical SAM superfamily enzyme YgiQ (UPF0313 family)